MINGFESRVAALEEAGNKQEGHNREQRIDKRVAPLAGLTFFGEALVGALQFGLEFTFIGQALLLSLDLLDAFLLRNAVGLDLGGSALWNLDRVSELILGFRRGGNAF